MRRFWGGGRRGREDCRIVINEMVCCGNESGWSELFQGDLVMGFAGAFLLGSLFLSSLYAWVFGRDPRSLLLVVNRTPIFRIRNKNCAQSNSSLLSY